MSAHGRRIAPLPRPPRDASAPPREGREERPPDPVMGRARPVNIGRTLAHHPLGPDAGLFGSRLLGEGLLPPRERELVVLRVGWRCGSVYEFGQHTLIGLQAGLTDEEIARIAGGPGGWSDDDAALLALADDLCATDDVSDATWASLAARYDDATMVELVLLAGYYRLVSGFLNATGVELEEWTPGWPPGTGPAPR